MRYMLLYLHLDIRFSGFCPLGRSLRSLLLVAHSLRSFTPFGRSLRSLREPRFARSLRLVLSSSSSSLLPSIHINLFVCTLVPPLEIMWISFRPPPRPLRSAPFVLLLRYFVLPLGSYLTSCHVAGATLHLRSLLLVPRCRSLRFTLRVLLSSFVTPSFASLTHSRNVPLVRTSLVTLYSHSRYTPIYYIEYISIYTLYLTISHIYRYILLCIYIYINTYI